MSKQILVNQPKAKIFLADERSCNENESFRTYSTFNFGEYFSEQKKAFQNLYALNDETIAAGYSQSSIIEEDSHVLLLPVVGTLLCKVNERTWSIVDAGQLQIFRLNVGDSIEILNCYKVELVNFIHARVRTDDLKKSAKKLFTFDIDENKNNLIDITGPNGSNNLYASIGKFTGRCEAGYKLKNKKNNLFAFVIEGVFEVDGKLLHARDGLGLWNEPCDIEMEALSNNAIIYFIEFSSI